MDAAIASSLITGSMLLTGHFVIKYLNRDKEKAERENKVTEQYNILNSAKSEEIKRLTEKVNNNEKTILEQMEINRKQQLENDECKYTSSALRLQVKRLNQIVDFHGYEWEKVYVLDDNKMVTIGFEKHFKDAGIAVAVFSDYVPFIKDVNLHKPAVLIIDNWMGEIEAEHVIGQITYKPEIIIMSQDYSLKAKFADRGIKFFPKTEHYILKIAQAVIEYLTDKN